MDYQTCAYINCKGRVAPHLHGGRPKKYCCDQCRVAAYQMRKRLRYSSKYPNRCREGSEVNVINHQTATQELAEIRRSRLRGAVMRREKTMTVGDDIET